MCIRVEFHHTGMNGLPSPAALSMNFSAAVVTSSSTVSMRFSRQRPRVLDLAAGEAVNDAARPELLPEFRIFG